MPRKFLLASATLALLLIGHAAAFAGGRAAHVPRLGIQFNIPEGFILGRFLEEKIPETLKSRGYDAPFQHAAVLAEPGELTTHTGQNFEADAIPVGEIPVIWLDRLRGNRARFMKSILREGQKKVIGEHTVYQLPGYPGPYGDAVFYYLLPIEGGDLLEIGGHRLYFRGVHPKSGEPAKTTYDRTIEQIVGTLEFSAPDP